MRIQSGSFYDVDVLYGYAPRINRGVSFSQSDSNEWGYVDRGINAIQTTITIQGDPSTMANVDKVLSDQGSVTLWLDDGEKIFGPEFWGRAAGTETPVSASIVSKGPMVRKGLELYTMECSLGMSYDTLSSGYLDTRISDLTTAPEWSDIAIQPQYTNGGQNSVLFKWLYDGIDTSTRGTTGYIFKGVADLTGDEAARWSYAVTAGTRRITNTVVKSTMGVDLFNADYSTYSFFVRTWNQTQASFDRWTIDFELILRKNASII